MRNMKKSGFIYWIKKILFYLSILFSLFSIILAFCDADHNFIGTIKNLPNTIPWLLLIFLYYLSIKHQLIGGIFLILYSMILSALIILTYGSGFFLMLTVPPLFLIGLILMINSVFKKK